MPSFSLETPLKSAKPIFVVGTGRSGSTVFFDVLSKHPSVAWFSTLSRRYPEKLWLSRYLMLARSIGFVDALLGRRLGPSEAYPLWDYLCPGFSNPFRDLTESDVTVTGADNVRTAVGAMTNGTRTRFLAKITGWPRVGFLDRIFRDAVFIEVRRDPRATTSSLLHVPFWDGWRGPTNWRRGPLPPDLKEIWLSEQQSFVALAALECVMVQRAVNASFAKLDSSRYCVIKYSELCANPVAEYRWVADFCGLKWTRRFESAVLKFPFRDRDDHWKQALTTEQQRTLERTLQRACQDAPT
jgi:omega-hydroxy-beta-dihydromenaquinone-9 sulfotransferase